MDNVVEAQFLLFEQRQQHRRHPADRGAEFRTEGGERRLGKALPACDMASRADARASAKRATSLTLGLRRERVDGSLGVAALPARPPPQDPRGAPAPPDRRPPRPAPTTRSSRLTPIARLRSG